MKEVKITLKNIDELKNLINDLESTVDKITNFEFEIETTNLHEHSSDKF